MGNYTVTERKNLTNEYRKYVVMNKSNHSYAQNNQIITIFNKNSWLNKRCFIIGGGESLKGFNFNVLDKELTIGINKTFQTYDKVNINYSMDISFYDLMLKGDYDKLGEAKLWDKWMAFKGHRIFLTPMNIKQFGNEVYLVRRNIDPSFNRVDLDSGIWGGTNSGMGAISLAIALGINEIYLLGYDYKALENTHWHSGYEINRDMAQFNLKLKSYKEELEKIAPKIKELGVVIYNCNPSSELKCFPFVDIQKIFKNEK